MPRCPTSGALDFRELHIEQQENTVPLPKCPTSGALDFRECHIEQQENTVPLPLETPLGAPSILVQDSKMMYLTPYPLL